MARREQVLIIDPPNEISFTGDFTVRVCKTKLSLSNPTDMKIAYKVKTTAPRRYCVRPNSGQIPPGETAEVNIMLQPSQNNEDLQKHKFMVQSIELGTPEQLEMPVDDLFKGTPSSMVMSKKLYCQFNNVADEEGQESPPAYVTNEEIGEMDNGEQVEVPLTRPEIKSGVPTEPELIPQEPAVLAKAAPIETENLENSTQPAKVVEKPMETSKLTPVKANASQQKPISSETATNNQDSELKKKNQLLQRDVVNLQAQLKSMRDKLSSAGAQSTVATPLQGEDPATVKKVMIILFVIAFILGWMVSSFFCKSC